MEGDDWRQRVGHRRWELHLVPTLGSSIPLAANLEAGLNALSAANSFGFNNWTKDHSGGTSADPVITDNAVAGPNGATDASSGVFSRGTGSFSRIQVTATVPANLPCRFDVWLASPDTGLNISLRANSKNGIALTLSSTWQYFALDDVGSGVGGFSAQLLLFSSITNSPATATAYMWGARVYRI